MPLTATQRRTRSRLAAYVQWSREPDRHARMAPARAGFLRRFLDQVDPGQVLPEDEREQLARQAMRAHMAAIAQRPRPSRRRRS